MISSGSLRRLGSVLFTGIALSVLLGGTVSCVRRPIKLAWKLEEGKTYVYRSEVEGSSKIIVHKADGADEVLDEGKFGNLIMTEMTVLGSEADSAWRMREVIKLVREGTDYAPTVVEYLMAPNGKLYDIISEEEGSAPRVFQSTERREQYFNETQPAYPARELKPGDVWMQETKVVLDDRVITAENEFNVQRWERVERYLCLVISYKSNVVIPYTRAEKKVWDRGTVKGTIWFAPYEGLLIQQRDTFNFTTERVVPEGETPPATYALESVRTYQLQEVR